MAQDLKVELNNGVEMPMVGSGAWAPHDPEAQAKVKGWIATALQAGFRHIDTAHEYDTERAVGDAIGDSGIPRNEVWVTTKFPWHHHDRVKESFEESLENLGLGYVDLYLMHFPQCVLYEDGQPAKNPDGSWKTRADVSFNESWAEMEKLLETGKVKAIGVANFSIKTLEQLLKTAKVVPAVNQVEMHPYLAQNDLRAFCKEKGIAIMAYAPTGYATVRNDPLILSLAQKYNAAPIQVILAWHLYRQTTIIPKSQNVERQKENITLITLEKEDLERIDALDRNQRLCNKPDATGTVYGWTAEQLGW
ncbi:Aldo/keto reductase [Macrolepiota fuliginosa MF-IS2]|uniref:Aldo/keto reductase n=1 Tax=Macrolepiota fuliginosa MF-IS2 TaxID=1400762 RepID=A0A9P5XHZ3_9AGAR|nr:Aldo/keto reductase [Macrolepiota fuliginosa MF-IS2]